MTKTILTKAFALVAAGMLMFSCVKPVEPTLSVNTDLINFSADAGLEKAINVTSNQAWTVTCDADWLVIEPKAGENDGQFKITTKANEGFTERSADVKVATETLSKTIKVTQAGNEPMIALTTTSDNIDANLNAIVFPLTSNTSWEVVMPEGVDFIAVEPMSGTGDASICISVDANQTLKAREAVVVFKETTSGKEVTFTVNQGACEPCRATDSLALVAIFKASNGDNWTKDKWDLTKPMSEWKGVTLTDDRVTALKMTGKNFPGEWTMPEEIGDLLALTDLRFNGAQVTGDFVEQLYKLTNLVSLYFQTNNILGSFSEKVTSWPNIKDIYINDNPSFGGTLPKELGQLKKLANINIAKTSIGGDVPAELSGCDALVNFMVYGTKLTSLPDNFDQWPSLKLIQVYDIPTLTGALPASCGNCTKLTSLWMYGCNFEGNIPESYANLPATCKQLRIMNNKLSGTVPAAVKAHANWNTTTWKPAQYILPQQDGYGLTE